MIFAPTHRTFRAILGLAALTAALQAHAGVGTYTFNNTLSALEGGAPSLSAVNAGSYGTASIYGATRSVYNTAGANNTAANAGFTLDAGSLLTGNQYSLEMVVALTTTGADSGYRKLADVSNRASDTGYYVLNSKLDVFNLGNGPTAFTVTNYNYLVLTVSGDVVKGYVNGALDFTFNTNVMDFSTFGTAVGGFNFFLDDSPTGGGEYSNVSVGLLRLRDTVLTDQQIATLAVNPFPNPVPEPATCAALGLGALALLRRRKAA